MLQKLVINKIIELLSKQFKLFDIMKYVKEPNELDIKVKKLEKENKKMKVNQADLEDRIKQLEALDYGMCLRGKKNG